MADYWKSQPRKFCQYCKCWIADNKPSIEFHERGKNHKENVAAKISEIKKKSVQKAKQEDRMSKQFAAMEEAALKAYEEDLKRMEMEAGSGPCVQTPVLPQPKAPPLVLCELPPHRKKYQKKTDKARKSSVEQKRTQTWVEGWTNDRHAYYYNTVTGDSQWDRPEGFLSSSDFVQPGQYESPSDSAWMEGVSPEGYSYWYNTETGESRWEKPNDIATNETTKSSLASSSEKVLQEELTSGEEGCNGAQLSQGAEATEQHSLPSTVPENSSRKRKVDGEHLGKDEDDQTSNKMPGEYVKEEKKEAQSTTIEPIKKKQEEVAKTKKPKSLNPYGAWEQIKEEKDPYTSVDLELPQVAVEEVAPTELPPEPKLKFKERIITSLRVEGGLASFKKSKTQNGKSRSFRQRDNND
ncbi:WW domain-binding protein 4 [Phyllopteryx taeniolatus]|uniref:WW domain-binding protein 4 n=1 Tax=Phyllopteryx taeniolatus TaxID=161469 RepID=UPI002AD3A5A0|nr:WW domain-binding protein 4 [Phyllopteryx taeniolatus]